MEKDDILTIDELGALNCIMKDIINQKIEIMTFDGKFDKEKLREIPLEKIYKKIEKLNKFLIEQLGD